MGTFFENPGLMHIGLQILEYLDPKSLGYCRLVNRTWCEFITEQRFWAVARLDLLKVKTELEGPTEIVREKWDFWSEFVKKAKEEQSKEVLKKIALFLDHQMKISNGIYYKYNALYEAMAYDPWIGIEQLLTNGETELAKMIIQWIKDELKYTPYIDCKSQTSTKGLLVSCVLGLEELAKLFLLDPFMNINAITEMGELPPYIVGACQFNPKTQVSTKVKIVEVLLQTRPELNINAVDRRRRSALHYSALCGDVESVTKLLTRTDINVNAIDAFGCTPLHCALLPKKKKNIHKISSLFLSHSDININISCGLFHTALTMAGSKGYTEVMSSLLKMPGINIHITNEQNEDTAQILCKRGKFQAFKLLYSHDKQIIHKKYLGGRTLLHSVFEHDANKGKSHGHRELLKLLLNIANFDANAQDDKLATPLHYACKGSIELMEELLKSDKIDVNARDKDGITPLHFVISGCSFSLEKTKLLLQQKRIDVNATATISGITNRTLLHLAYCTRNNDISEALLKVKGIDVNAVDGQGMTYHNYLRGPKRLASQTAKASIKLSFASTTKKRRI